MEASKSRQLTSQVSTFSQTETELRSQLNIYVEKFKQVCLVCNYTDNTDSNQVEDTLNNSNDLFLTFRKEMEDMSKKTKRLEKENHTLTRKHDLTNRNILQMAEERTKVSKELDVLRKKNDNLEKLCRGMQAQGRGVVPPNLVEVGAGTEEEMEEDSEGTESEYEYDEDENEEGSEDEGEYDDTEEDLPPHPHPQTTPPTFGPVPPPPLTSAGASPAPAQRNVNGRSNGQVHVNGTKH